VRRGIAAILLVLTCTIPVLDTLACPDGCTNASRQVMGVASSDTVHEGTCVLCLGGYAVTVISQVMASSDRLSPLSVVPASGFISNTPSSLDRPPRG
jgi:hypothetical protein